MGQPAPGEVVGAATPVPVSQGYPAPQYAPYTPYPGPLALPPGQLPGPTGYEMMQQDQTPLHPGSPTPMLVQLGASQNFLVNNRPARWIQVLDVDPSYQRARTPSPNRAPGKKATNILAPSPSPPPDPSTDPTPPPLNKNSTWLTRSVFSSQP